MLEGLNEYSLPTIVTVDPASTVVLPPPPPSSSPPQPASASAPQTSGAAARAARGAKGRGTRRKIICAPVTRPKLALIALAAVSALGLTACGQEIEVAKSDPNYHGAELFYQRCSGCHTFDAAAAQGAATRSVKTSERTNGPNFNVRKEGHDDVLFAIRNGG